MPAIAHCVQCLVVVPIFTALLFVPLCYLAWATSQVLVHGLCLRQGTVEQHGRGWNPRSWRHATPAWIAALPLAVCWIAQFIIGAFTEVVILLLCEVAHVACCFGRVWTRPAAVAPLTVDAAPTTCTETAAPAAPSSPAASDDTPAAQRRSLNRSERDEAAARYVKHDAVWAALDGDGETASAHDDVRLVRLSWLMALGTPGTRVHAEFGGVLRRRQDLPEAAFVGADELRAMERNSSRGFDGERFLDLFREDFTKPFRNIRQLGSFFCGRGLWRRNIDELLPIVAVS